jgi:hypothetical protein
MDKIKAFSVFRMTSPPEQDSSLQKMAAVPSYEIDVNEKIFFPFFWEMTLSRPLDTYGCNGDTYCHHIPYSPFLYLAA